MSGLLNQQTPPAPAESSTRAPLPKIAVTDRSHKEPGFLDLVQETLRPERHYRWVRCRSDEHMMSVNRHKLRGYTLETIEGGVQTVVEPDRRPDGIIAIGDMILMSCPKDERAARAARIRARTEALLASTSAETERMAKEKGISLIKDADHT